ncbi:MAG: hypothetical protein ACRDRJ_00285 [Streptosporangiaceae bacterium]
MIGAALDARAGAVRVVSACADAGREVMGTLAAHADRARVSATLSELHPAIADAARTGAAAGGLRTQVQVRTVDAGISDTHLGLARAELVLLVGVFGAAPPTGAAMVHFPALKRAAPSPTAGRDRAPNAAKRASVSPGI